MKRSVGLILSAVVLGLIAAALLLTAGSMIVAAISMRPSPLTPPPPPFLRYIVFAMAGLFALLFAWAITTVVGLVFLRIWARYSILVIGGGLSAVGVFSVFGILVALFASRMGMASAPHPGVSNGQMTLIFSAIALFYAAIAAVGVWWLILFNTRATKDLFLQRPTIDPLTGLITSPRPPSRRPTAITILACLALFSAVTCLLFAFLPFPAFLLGFIFPGAAGHALFAALALAMATVGAGLLRLHPAARIGAMALFILGCLNLPLTLTPWYQDRFRAYMQSVLVHIPAPANTPPGTFNYPASQMIVSAVLGLLVNLFLLWLLHRHRAAFTPPPPIEEASSIP